jgi:hypothetical protein
LDVPTLALVRTTTITTAWSLARLLLHFHPSYSLARIEFVPRNATRRDFVMINAAWSLARVLDSDPTNSMIRLTAILMSRSTKLSLEILQPPGRLIPHCKKTALTIVTMDAVTFLAFMDVVILMTMMKTSSSSSPERL